MSDLFKKFLIDIGKSEKTAKNYSGALKAINSIASKINIDSIEDWQYDNLEDNIRLITDNKKFK
jgi:hypothetical protein